MARSRSNLFSRISGGLLSLALLLSVGAVSYAQTVSSTLLLQGLVNGIPAVFMVDTGAERSVIDRAFATKSALTESEQAQIETTLGSDPSSVVKLSSLDIDGLHVDGVQVLTKDLGSMSKALGVPINGVLGVDILRRGLFKLDFQKGEVYRAQPLDSQSSPKSLNLLLVGNLFYVNVFVGTRRLRLLLDTGANLTTLSQAGWDKVEVRDKRGVVRGLKTSATSDPSQLSCVSHLRLSDVTLDEIPLRIAPPSTAGLLAEPGVDGLLGSDVLSRYVLTIDLASNRAWCEPAARYSPDVNRFSSVGIQFVKNTEGSFTVVSVWEPSPASLAGVQAGASIIQVAGRSTSVISTEQMSSLLHASPGNVVTLTTSLQGVVKSYVLRTRRLACGTAMPRSR